MKGIFIKMFSENMEVIKKTFSECKGTGMYFALFFVSIIYIFLKEKDKNKKIIFGYFPLIVLLVILNPIFNKIIDRFINQNVYFRMFWLLPIGFEIVYVAVDIIQGLEQKIKKIFMLIAIILIIISSGKFIYTEENYIKVHNLYKIPDQAKWVITIISEDTLENKKVMLPESLVPYIRQVNSNIELAYPRQPYGYESNDLLRELHNGNVQFVTEMSKEKKCNYIVFENSVELTDDITNYGYELLGQTYSYDVYKLKE